MAPLLLAAAYLHVPPRRIRALASGSDAALAEWLQAGTSTKVAHARKKARDAAGRLRELGVSIVSYGENAYPEGLRDLEDAPAMLFVRGTLPQGGIALVGSRTPPPEAAQFAFELAARMNAAVISGLAAGIDAAAHRGALHGGRTTAAYIGCGLGITYPADHRELEDAIVAQGGAIVSERLPDEPVTRWALVRRDRLQAAHARATVLVSSELEGGAMHTLRFAAKLGRPRFVWPWFAGDAYAGNAQARSDGASELPLDAPAAAKVLA